MAGTPGERIATNEQRITELGRRLDGIEHDLEEVASRNRKTEWAVKLIVDAQRNAQETVARRQRRLEVRIQILTAVIAAAALLVSVVLGTIH